MLRTGFSPTGAKEPRDATPTPMSDLLPIRAKLSPSTARNRHPILEVLKPRLPPTGFVREIAAAPANTTMLPRFPICIGSQQTKTPSYEDNIAAWRDHAALHGLDKKDEHLSLDFFACSITGMLHPAASDFEFNPSSAIYTAPTTTL